VGKTGGKLIFDAAQYPHEKMEVTAGERHESTAAKGESRDCMKGRTKISLMGREKGARARAGGWQVRV